MGLKHKILDALQKINEARSVIGKETIGGGKESYNLMFYGFGKIARSGIEAILSALAADENILYSPINSIFIAGRTKPLIEDETRKRWEFERYIGEGFVTKYNVHINPIPEKEISKYLKNTDIFFLTAGDDPTDPEGRGRRLAMTVHNLGIIDHVAPFFPADYQGMVNILTNQPELCAYRLAQVSQIQDPRRITGNGQLDLRRANSELLRMLAQNFPTIRQTDIFCIGYHGEGAWPVVNGLNRREGTGWEPILIGEDIQSKLCAIIRGYGPSQGLKQKEAGGKGTPTVESTGVVILDVVLAYINRDRLVNLSCFYKTKDDEGRYVLVPTTLENGLGIPDQNYMSRLTQRDKEERDKLIEKLCDISQLDEWVKKYEAELTKKYEKKIEWIDKPVILTPEIEKATEEQIAEERNYSISRGTFQAQEVKPPIAIPTRTKVGVPSGLEHKLNGTLYYKSSSEPLIIHALDLSDPDPNKERKFRVKVQDDRYDSRISLERIILYAGKLFVEGLYTSRETQRSHIIWFDTSAKRANGFIEPLGSQALSIGQEPIALLHFPYVLESAEAIYNGKFYFLNKKQERDNRVVIFDPSQPPNYQIIGSGVNRDETLIGVFPLTDDLIFAGDKNFYRLHKNRLKQHCEALYKPTIIRGIPQERLVAYATHDKPKIYAFTLDSCQTVTEFPDGPYFELEQFEDILMATILNEKVQLARYSGIPDFLQKKAQDTTNYSATIEGLKRIVLLNNNILLAFAQNENDMTIHSLNTSDLKRYTEPITIKNAYYLTCEIDHNG